MFREPGGSAVSLTTIECSRVWPQGGDNDQTIYEINVWKGETDVSHASSYVNGAGQGNRKDRMAYSSWISEISLRSG